MKHYLIPAALSLALAGMTNVAGIGHNMPPSPVDIVQSDTRAVLPRRIVDENRRNQKLKQKLRRKKRPERLRTTNRFTRKCARKGSGYHAGKLFKGHRI